MLHRAVPTSRRRRAVLRRAVHITIAVAAAFYALAAVLLVVSVLT